MEDVAVDEVDETLEVAEVVRTPVIGLNNGVHAIEIGDTSDNVSHVLLRPHDEHIHGSDIEVTIQSELLP